MFQVRKLRFLDACPLATCGIASAVTVESAPFSKPLRCMSFPPFTCCSSRQGEFLHPAASELQRDRPNLMKRPLRLEANDNALARLSRRDQRSTLVKRRDDCGKLLFQLEYLPGRRMLDHLAGGASTP